MKNLTAFVLFLMFTAGIRATPDCGTGHLVLVGKPSGPEETSAWNKLKSDLATRFHVLPIDFAGDDAASIAELPTAKLLVLGSSPAEWPADLIGGVRGYLDRGYPLLVLDDGFKDKTASNEKAANLWQRLDLALGCDAVSPAPEPLFAKANGLVKHRVMSGVADEAKAALAPAASPCHLLFMIASDDTRGPLAWMSAYQALPPADRFGNVAVVPLSSAAQLASADVRRLILQASLAATDSEDLIPTAGMPVAP